MERSIREDYLEAILVLSRKGKIPSPEELAVKLKADPSEIRKDLAVLALEGFITRDADSHILLTASGEKLAGTIERKHRVLQRFFTDILGMDNGIASDEACQVEHEVSDEAVEKLRMLTSCGAGCISPGASCKGIVRPLAEFTESEPLVVCAIIGRDGYERLADLGIVPGAPLVIRRKIADGAILVRVKECDIALSPDIAAVIRAERAG